MPQPAAATLSHRPIPRAVMVWLGVVAALIFAMVIVGGATRLTESGLSIVEWKPVSGTLPPLSDAQWRTAFENYQAIPQYKIVNRGMSLDEFKTIFWWEWAHRLLGRVIGIAFLAPFLFFLWRGAIRPPLRGRLAAIFVLGGVQGAVGWWMVSSGLAERTSVSQYRLAFHLTLACAIFAAIVWTMRRADQPQNDATPPRSAFIAAALAGLVLAQIYLGALVAGLRAGLIYNTWPQIDGALVPSSSALWFEQPAWRNFFENTLMVQFNHRMTAYAIWALALFHAIDTWRSGALRTASVGAWLLFGAVTLQAAVGIATLLNVTPIGLALLHQSVAMVVLTVAVVHAADVCWRRRDMRYATPALAR